MTVPGNLSSPLLATAAAADAAAAGPIKSVRFNDDGSAYLAKTFSSAGNRKTFTFSFWVKRAGLAGNMNFLSAAESGFSNPRSGLRFKPTDELSIEFNPSGSTWYILVSDAVFRDPSAWYHIVISVDTTQATSSNRTKIYVNGVQQTMTGSYVPQNTDLTINSTFAHAIGRFEAGDSNYLDGYLADVYFIDGSALDPTSFGAFDDNGVWQSAAYSGTFGTNGFHLFDFANESGIGNDSSGNDNDWTANNLDPNEVFTSFNLDVTSTPFTDIGKGETITNQGSVSTATASSNSFNLGTVAEFDGTGQYLSAPTFTLSDNYTFDYYFNSNTTQVSNATIIDIGAEAMIRDYGTATTRNIRLKDTSGSRNDYQYTVTANTWNHVRVSNSGIWVNGTSIQSSPRQIGGTSGLITIGSFNQSTTNYIFDGEIGPVRISDKDLGAPASGGLVANSDGTLSNVIVDNPGCDVLRDVPTNGTQSDTGAGGEVSANYCTWNPLQLGTSASLSNGNLDVEQGSGVGTTLGTIGVSSGKWYWEVTHNGGTYLMIGVAKPEASTTVYLGSTSDGYGYFDVNGNKYNTSSSSYGASYATGDVIGVALDMDAGTLTFYKNGTSQGTAFTGLSGTLLPAVGDTGGGAAPDCIANFGARSFAYSAPSGFKALCTTNLPTATVPDGSDYFDIDTYTGTNATLERSNFSFQPDFLWFKARSYSGSHALVDSVRGISKQISSNLTNAESTNTGGAGPQSFDSDGFTLGTESNATGSTNGSQTYVAWAWDAGANSSKTFTVKVVSDSGNKYRFDDFGTSAVTLDLEEGSTYVFDSSDSSVDSHPFVIGTSANSNEYSTGVTYTLDGVTKTYSQYTSGFAAATTRKLTITVPSGAPTLYYWCSVHSGMGGQVNTNSTAGSSNFDGSIQSTVKANQTAGFSIVSYTGNGSNSTIGHGLNAAPEVIIVKTRDSAFNWFVYHKHIASDAETDYLKLNATSAAADLNTAWNDTAPTSSVFSVGTDGSANESGDKMIAYCFAPVAGYSAFGSYTGNGSSEGPFVFTNFRPAWIMYKNASGTHSWVIFDSTRDTYNISDSYLLANSNAAEADADTIDFLSNGFKIRSTASSPNGSGNTITYMAFAENPFQANGGLAR